MNNAHEPMLQESADTPGSELYLDLLKRALTHMLYWPPDSTPPTHSAEMMEAVQELLQREGSLGPLDFSTARAEGRDWPKFAQTMVGRARLDNVQSCLEQVIADDVPGDMIEAGVWRGGVTILMRGVLKARQVADRKVFVADSFRGLPPPDAINYPADTGDLHHESELLAVSREDVARNFELYGLLDDQVVFVEGWFRDTLPMLSDRLWSMIRADGDLYESTMETLTHLYPQLSPGGFVIVDDFAYAPCRQAVEDFRAHHGITDQIEEVDWTGVYWRRSGLT